MIRAHITDKYGAIDLRSDTVTLPTAAMRRVMAEASVGDDGYDEDPSVHQLQELAAQLLGKEAALFMPSGIMSNQAAFMVHTKPGNTLVAGDNHHTVTVEKESTLRVASLQIQAIGQHGIFSAVQLKDVFASDRPQRSAIGVVSVENTINFGGGSILSQERLAEISAVTKEEGVALHMDGARLWNAVVATGIPAWSWASYVDTICFCLSKGLGAPVGSVISGRKETIEEIRKIRKLLGGTMRQVGVLAAAGTFALTHHIHRLAEDHHHAKILAEGLQRLGFQIDPWPQTNIVNFTYPMLDSKKLANQFAEAGVKMNVIPTGKLRAVTHLGIISTDIDQVLERARRICSSLA